MTTNGLTPLGALRALASGVTSRVDELAAKADAALPYPGPAVPAPPTLPALPDIPEFPAPPINGLEFINSVTEVKPMEARAAVATQVVRREPPQFLY